MILDATGFLLDIAKDPSVAANPQTLLALSATSRVTQQSRSQNYPVREQVQYLTIL